MSYLGKTLIVLGLILVAIGVLLLASQKVPWLGKLPGDICVQKKDFTFYFPITTCILVSIVISLIFFLVGRR